MIAVVTGGTGFIGRNLVRRLLTNGHDVRCLVRPTSGDPPQGARRCVVDFHDPRALLGCDALRGADVVFHVAGVTSATSPGAFAAGNVSPTRHLLGALVARGFTPRVVYVSSQAAAGPAPSLEQPIDEDDQPRPVEPYGASKLQAEHVVRSFGHQLPVAVVRPCAVFGPYDRDFLTLFRFAMRGIIPYPSTADHWMSLLHVRDAVTGILAAGHRDEAIGRVYFLASHVPVQWRTFGEEIERTIGHPVRHVNIPGPLVTTAAALGEVAGRILHRTSIANRSKAALARHPYWVCASERAKRELGFTASCSLPEAVRDAYYWYRDNGWLGGPRAPRTAAAIT